LFFLACSSKNQKLENSKYKLLKKTVEINGIFEAFGKKNLDGEVFGCLVRLQMVKLGVHNFIQQ
jgi:hypothetical protein